ncbi:NAD(P)H-binding protein [Altererythrobacter aquiaggeris]|uniref:NAD(P)H-binding protein n=1 Tax=Aestuarierythrobacter aquiaggeris TaxID=1898396 RepID=UPI0030178B2A
MSDVTRIALVGSTGLIGSEIVRRAVGRNDYRIVAISRRELDLPPGAKMEVLIAPPEQWGDAIAAANAAVFACALGTTWNKSGRSEDAFRAVDQRLVLDSARAAKGAGARQAVIISSIGADARSKNFYLRVKGEVEDAFQKMKFKRLDILRPGLLRGHRGDDRRVLERLGILASPITNLVLQGPNRKYRAIDASTVAEAMLVLAAQKAGGRFMHDNDAINRAASRIDR